MKYRFIFSGIVWEEPQLKNYKLFGRLRPSGCQAIRVNIPDNIVLNKHQGDSYSTTGCEKTIHDLGCDCYILYNSKWRKFNWLKNIEPCWWFRALKYIFGLCNSNDPLIGWTDDLKYYKNWSRFNLIRHELEYPPFREDQKGLKLRVNLETNSNLLSILRNGSGENEWLKFYDVFSRQLKEIPGIEIWCE
jgi:hypothetical protein